MWAVKSIVTVFGTSTGAVSSHTSAVTAVVDVGAELNHSDQRFAAAAAAADA